MLHLPSKLHIEFQSNSKILSVKLFSLRQEFETVKMKNGEKVQDLITRILDIVYQIRNLGEEILEQGVVGKILRSLTSDYKHIVSSIVEAKDLSKLTVEELSSSLKNHEPILVMSASIDEEVALPTVNSFSNNTSNRGGRGRAHGSFRLRFRGRGRGRFGESSSNAYRQQTRQSVQCYVCKKFGHTKAQCWYNEVWAPVLFVSICLEPSPKPGFKENFVVSQLCKP